MNQMALNNVVKYFEDKVGRKIIDAETQSLIYAFVSGESYMSAKFNEAEEINYERRYRNKNRNDNYNYKENSNE